MAAKIKEEKEKKTEKTTNKKRKLIPIVIILSIVAVIAAGLIAVCIYEKDKYSDKFLPNTYINDLNVSGKTLDEAKQLFLNTAKDSQLVITKRDNTKIIIPASKFDFKYDTNEQLEEIYKTIDHSKWYKSIFGQKTEKEFESKSSFDKAKLENELKAADWGKVKNQDAKIAKGSNGFEIVAEVQGDNMDFNKLKDYIIKQVEVDILEINATDSKCYIEPKIKSGDLTETLEKFNKAFNQKINIDFDYTKETLTGDKLVDMLTVGENGNFTADKDKVMKYVEELAEKYDTYNKKRKFKATIQGDITIPTSSDAKYGWWIDQDKTCDLIVQLIEKGENVDSVDPIYYQNGSGYVFTGREAARTANDDIGNTYVEIDLTKQHLWYYENGKLEFECDIVSGQTTSAARTTLPGVYKVWYKAKNYTMKGSNSDGEEWKSKCSYWNRVAIVGIGLHDSQWRGSAFGGSIYKYNGSHGCINMPLNGAKYIYDNVAMDTPVVMYY